MSATALIFAKAAGSFGLAALCSANDFTFGEGVAANWLSDHLPAVLRALLPQRVGDPNHDLNRAFHAALRDTLATTTGQSSPLRHFRNDTANDAGAIHTGQWAVIDQWFKELAQAAKDTRSAGQAPLIAVDDAFLKTLAEDRQGAQLAILRNQLAASLRQRLAAVQGQSDPSSDRACALFIDWFTRHISQQFTVHFWQQLKTDEKARTAYFGLVAQELQTLLMEVAGHALGTREDLLKLSADSQQRATAILSALSQVQQFQQNQTSALNELETRILAAQSKIHHGITLIQRQLSRIDEGMQQLLGGFQPPLHHIPPSDQIRTIGPIAITQLDYRQRLIPFQPRPAEFLEFPRKSGDSKRSVCVWLV